MWEESKVKYLVLRGKKPSHLEFCTLQNYPSKVKENLKCFFSDKQKLREFVAGRPALQEILKVFKEKKDI